jgi:2-polyprenyl-3-methyl-5-hydroxy-6-metoxy-1,4-benzoquinol methylase
MSHPQKQYMVDGRLLSEEEVRKTFNNGAVDLAKLDTREREALDMAAVAAPGGRFLDVGCYSGAFVAALRLAYPGMDVHGADAYEDNILIARLLYPGIADRFQRASVYDLPYETGAFDCVSFKEVIEHIDRPVDAIRNINSVLRIGGHLILTTPNANADAWRLFYSRARRLVRRAQGRDTGPGHQLFYDNMDWGRHIYAWTANTLNTLLMCNGFEYVKHRFYCRTAIQRTFPEMGDGLAFLVRKVKPAPTTLV